uniref:MBG domain-containing protein n=1 Tax=Cyclobacterium plantarum TaxID=2716263 RepID=UPI003F702DD4
AGSNVGTYPIALTGGSDGNYAITLVAGELEVTKAALTITADDKSKVYGEANPALTFSYTGLVNGDTEVSEEPVISTTATESSNVGSYPVTLTGGSDVNYDISLVAGELEITQAALTITADNKSKVYGDENPALTFTYIGLVNGDTKVSDEPAISTTATAGSNVGTYSIALTGGSDDNYAITLVAGELEVTQAALTITADDKSKVYGMENPVLTYQFEGLLNGDTEVSVLPEIVTAATLESGVGVYPISLSGAEDHNYQIKMVAGTLEVMPKTLEVKANGGLFKTFGDSDPEFTYLASGFEGTDDYEVIGGQLEREPGEAPGTYAINQGSLDAGKNYQVQFSGNQFEIIEIVVVDVLEMAPVQMGWGEAIPELPATVLVITDRDEIINLSVTWDSSVVDVLASGQYTLTGSLELGSVHENPENQQAELTLVVEPKQAPSNLVITNNEFEGEEEMVQIGELEVIDAVDDMHHLELPAGLYDNGYFEILSGQLYWNSPERAEGKTMFQVLVRVTDRDGNVMDRLLEINRIRKSVSEIEVYNSFTPNGDGINDGWGVPDLRHYSGVSIQVFERSGKRVFYTQDPDHRWDGTFEGVDLPIGTYYWTVQVKETGETRKGMLNILKK